MAEKETIHEESQKFSKSVAAGMKSIFGGSRRTFFVLEHKDASEKHRKGETQEIIIDYIEIGRDPKCQVNFGDTFPTVSRRHASITKENNNWVIRQLSLTNPTLVNGKPIIKEWFLQNGDEIQLSLEGPRLGFLIPANSSTNSLGMTKRLSLFRKQALHPYKLLITALSVLFLVAVMALGWYLFALKGELAATEKNLAKKEIMSQVQVDSVIKIYETSIYYIETDKITVEYQGQMTVVNDYKWSGTGFLLTDGRFITARHVIWAWYFYDPNDKYNNALNQLANKGAKIIAYFTAYSPGGSRISFTSDDFQTDSSSDVYQDLTDANGNSARISNAPLNNGKDWASFKSNSVGNIKFDNLLSQNLKRGTQLHILGYPFGKSLQDQKGLQTMYSRSEVGQNGLVNGTINITARGFDHGNSGGPAFAVKEDDIYAVGIISASVGAIGSIVPIAAAR